MRLVLFALLMMVSAGAALAAPETAPTVGMIYGTKERNALWYECSVSQDDVLSCDFTQTAVMKKAKLSDLAKKLDEAKKQFAGVSKDTKFCSDQSSLAPFLDALKTGKRDALPKEAREKMATMNALEKRDLLALFGGIEQFCTAKTLDSYLAVTKLSHERDARTCLVSSYKFTQQFRRVQDSSGKVVWVVVSNPEGPCGVVQLSRFERDDAANMGTLTMWKYFARKTVTNPGGKSLVACDKLDQGTYPYDWRGPSESGMGCDYISFSSF